LNPSRSLPEDRVSATRAAFSAAAATATSLPFGAAAAATAAGDLAWRAQRMAAQSPGAAARERASRILPPGLLSQGVSLYLSDAKKPPELALAETMTPKEEQARLSLSDFSSVASAAATTVATAEVANEAEMVARLTNARAVVQPLVGTWELKSSHEEEDALRGLAAKLAATNEVECPFSCLSAFPVPVDYIPSSGAFLCLLVGCAVGRSRGARGDSGTERGVDYRRSNS